MVVVSCTSPYFKAIEGSGNCPVMLEARKQAGFELKFINHGAKNLHDLNLSFDNKFRHTLYGLYSVEKGLIKDSVFNAGDTLTFKFTEDLSNALYFNIQDESYIPKDIILSNAQCSTTWKLE